MKNKEDVNEIPEEIEKNSDSEENLLDGLDDYYDYDKKIPEKIEIISESEENLLDGLDDNEMQ